ncbi:hypothetical protein VTJ83DRAFT_4291 [Remersonia thermophila]|uniref:2EXR domain-containing protein n=1 Tax=Remersonia thermophila TaxID=72144 RepID=A0ABR4DBL4_9PEZI
MTSTNSPSGPREFTLFPLLPPEIRIQIYRYCCHPRITVLAYDPVTTSFHCPTPPPALLQVSREARDEGLRLYRRCPLDILPCELPADDSFLHDRDDDELPVPGGLREQRYFYHHPDVDTLYVPRPRPRGEALPAGNPLAYRLGYAPWVFEFERRLPWVKGDAVRRLAVDHVPASVRQPWEVYGKVCMMRSFGRLEEAYMVIGTVSDGAEGGAVPGAADDDDSHHRGGEGGGASAEGREIEFVDPRADDAKIMGIMERVRESFRVELGADMGLADRARLLHQERPGLGPKEMGLELVPKVVSDVGCRPALCAYAGLGGGGRAVF